MAGGGSERQTLLLLKHLDREAFRPLLYLTHRRGVLLEQVPPDVPVLSFDDAPAVPTPRWPGRVGAYHHRYLASLLKRFAIDVIYDRTFQMTMLAGPAARATRIPRVSTIVSPPSLAVPLLEQRYQHWKRRRLAKAYRQASQVVAVSQAAADSAATYYGLPIDKILTLHNPIDVAETRRRGALPCRQAVQAAAHDAVRLACIGRLSIEKGQSVLLQAMHLATQRTNLPAWKLFLVGEGPDGEQLARQAAQHGLAARIQFTGHLANPLPLLAQSHALILPSLFEGFPNVVLEAMSLGIPVIASDSGGTSELVKQGQLASLVPAGNPDALAAEIVKLLTGAEQAARAERRTQAQAAIEADYAIEAFMPRLTAILQAAAER